MNVITQGMEVDEVDALGRMLQAKGDQLRLLTQEVEGIVTRTVWDGPDAVAFKQQWWPEHRVRLEAVADQVHGFGQSALNNASEQRTASGIAVAPEGGRSPGVGAIAATAGAAAAALGAHGTTAPAPAALDRPGARVGQLPRSTSYDPDARNDGSPMSRGGYRVDDGGYALNNCTSWAYTRRAELGLTDRPASGHGDGWQWGIGPASTQPPTLGAAVSSPPTASNEFGHVMVVEGISADGSVMSISEMNRDGRETGMVSFAEWRRDPGSDLWRRSGLGNPVRLTFRP